MLIIPVRAAWSQPHLWWTRSNELLPDIAGEVQVDVGDGGHVLGEEAVQGEVELQGVDVREADEVSHQQGHRGAPAPARRPLL